jgi:hypothetical protein
MNYACLATQKACQDINSWQAALFICLIFESMTKRVGTPGAISRVINRTANDKIFYCP